ncbi:MAG: amino acid deaminase [Pseudolysinimonas sp.]
MPDPSAALREAAEGLARGQGTVAGMLPWLADQVRTDAAAGRFAGWATSTAIDENIASAVIPRAVFDELHLLAGLHGQWPVANAGLLHVYGYLLSTVATPYGLKRERWTDGRLAQALGLDIDAFAPWLDSERTTLHRVLDAALPILDSPVDPLLWIDDRTPPGAVVRTVVVSGALVYGVDGTLVTLFPLDTSARGWDQAILDGAPRLRYNAVVEGLEPGSILDGREVRARVG